MLVLLLSGVARGSLKLVTDGDDSALANSEAVPRATAKDIKRVGSASSSRSSQQMTPWNWHRQLRQTPNTSDAPQTRRLQQRRRNPGVPRVSRPGAAQRRGRAGGRSRNRRRPAAGRRPPQEQITRGGRFVSDNVLLDIHRRSLTSAIADPRAGNVRQRPGTECDLYAEFEPMYYTTVTRTASTVIHFSSNCMRTTSLAVENVFGTNRNINWAYHPRKLYLNIVGNLYEVTYSRPRVIDRRDILRSLRYSRANVGRTFSPPRNIRLGWRNSVYLAPQVPNSLTTATLNRFAGLRGYWRCQTRPRRFSNYNTRIRLRRAAISKFRKQGFSNREIQRLIRGNQFGPRATAMQNIESPEQVAGLVSRASRPQPQRRRRQPAARPRPRNLEVKQTGEGENLADSSMDGQPGNPSRKMQGGIAQQIQGAIRSVTQGRGRPAGTRRRRRGRRGTRRRPQARRQVSRFELEEERQRLEERRFIRQRLRNNFIWELVTVCTLR